MWENPSHASHASQASQASQHTKTNPAVMRHNLQKERQMTDELQNLLEIMRDEEIGNVSATIGLTLVALSRAAGTLWAGCAR